MQDSLDFLKEEPLQHQLRVFFNANPPVSQKLVFYLLSYTVPEAYRDLKPELQNEILAKLRNLIGIGGLVNRMRDPPNRAWLLVYGEVLERVLDDTVICSLVVGERDPQRLRLIDKLIFKGGTLGVINEIVDQDTKRESIYNSDSYSAFLSNGILQLCQNSTVPYKDISSFMMSTLGVTEWSYIQFFDVMFTQLTIDNLWSLLRMLRLFELKSVWQKLLWHYLPFRYFTVLDDANDKIVSLCRILESYGKNLSGILDVDFIERNLNNGSNTMAINKLVAYLIPSDMISSFITKLLRASGDKNALKSKPISLQALEIHLMIQLLIRSKNAYSTKSLLKNPVFLSFVSNRLESLSNNVKMIGIVFAEKLCELTGEDKIFKFDTVDEYGYLLDDSSYILPEQTNADADVAKDLSSCWKVLSAPQVIENEPDIDANIVDDTKQIQNLSLTELNDKELDSDMDPDNEDGDGDPSSVKPSKPLYIKDLLEYLTVDTSNKQAYDKRKLALTVGPTLIRQKAKFGNELALLADSLYTTFIALDNAFDDDQFYDWILQNLVAVIASHYTSSLHVCRLLLNGDYSLQQRVMILTSLTLAARELKGIQDDLVTKSYTKTLFPTNQLPPNVHRIFGIVDGLESQIQDELMLEASKDAQDQINGGVGKVLRMSSKLRKPSATTTTDIENSYRPPFIDIYYKVIVGRYFFFPLCNVWYESRGINIGIYSSILKSHFIKTLSLILHCSYPSSTDIHSMVREFLLIITSHIKQVGVDEIQLIESICTGVLIACEVCDENYLVTEFYNDLTIFHTWLSTIWELIIDNKVKSICAGVLLKITGLFEKHNRLIENQLNSMY
ncbi:telomere binding protein [Scheffersomyces spartinae]|uniref:Telomere binding protein n=1 Tax=Scheffersomyces spartinae TaxID=45513 RepID=A0A9P7V8L2_9ASCO|nr:telomere binding protein [Scheffersomyces spartinae]KAG7193372.1 telomere binding protein [Scheffersomyces spartinae]